MTIPPMSSWVWWFGHRHRRLFSASAPGCGRRAVGRGDLPSSNGRQSQVSTIGTPGSGARKGLSRHERAGRPGCGARQCWSQTQAPEPALRRCGCTSSASSFASRRMSSGQTCSTVCHLIGARVQYPGCRAASLARPAPAREFGPWREEDANLSVEDARALLTEVLDRLVDLPPTSCCDSRPSKRSILVDQTILRVGKLSANLM